MVNLDKDRGSFLNLRIPQQKLRSQWNDLIKLEWRPKIEQTVMATRKLVDDVVFANQPNGLLKFGSIWFSFSRKMLVRRCVEKTHDNNQEASSTPKEAKTTTMTN